MNKKDLKFKFKYIEALLSNGYSQQEAETIAEEYVVAQQQGLEIPLVCYPDPDYEWQDNKLVNKKTGKTLAVFE